MNGRGGRDKRGQDRKINAHAPTQRQPTSCCSTAACRTVCVTAASPIDNKQYAGNGNGNQRGALRGRGNRNTGRKISVTPMYAPCVPASDSCARICFMYLTVSSSTDAWLRCGKKPASCKTGSVGRTQVTGPHPKGFNAGHDIHVPSAACYLTLNSCDS